MNNEKYIRDYLHKLNLNQDEKTLDLILLLINSLPNKNFFFKGDLNQLITKKEKYLECLYNFALYNLKIKYNIEKHEFKNIFEKASEFILFILNKYIKDYYLTSDEISNLKKIFLEESSNLFYKYLEKRLQDLPLAEKRVISLLINSIHIVKKAGDWGKARQKDGYYNEYIMQTIGIKWSIHEGTSPRIGTILIDFNQKLNQAYQEIYDEIINIYDYKVKVLRKEFMFWRMGNTLLKMGIGYWTFFLTDNGNFRRDKKYFLIPNFIYYRIMNNKRKIQISSLNQSKVDTILLTQKKLSNLEFINQNKNEKREKNLLERHIEDLIVEDPSILEEGLLIYDQDNPRQYRIDIGIIDMLCKDINGNFVVIEIKRDTGKEKHVGQILKYLSWIDKNLANNNFNVRGILVVKKKSRGLEYAVEASKYKIKVLTFGEIAPIHKNIVFCTECGKPNRFDATYCIICGKEIKKILK